MRLMSDGSYQVSLIQDLARIHVIPISQASGSARSGCRRMEASDRQGTESVRQVDGDVGRIYFAPDFLVSSVQHR
jgi:hypothetical protein